jgi:hypothetical protein
VHNTSLGRHGEGVLLFESRLIRRIRHNHYPAPDWVHQQANLSHYPKESMLRNHV